MKFNIHTSSEDQIPQQSQSQLQQQQQQLKGSTLTHIVRPDLDRLDQMIGKLQRCTTSANTTCISPIDNETMNRQQQQLHSAQRLLTSKCRAPLPPPPSISSSSNNNTSKLGISSALPGTFISSLRQLFSILDKTNSGYVPFDLFKRYWTPSFSFNNSSSTSDILHELEIESKPNNYLITFDLLLNVIERSLSSTKNSSSSPPPPITTSDSSLSSLSTPPIIIPKATRPPPPISFPLNRSTSVVVTTPTQKNIEQQIPVVYRSYNGTENNHYHSHDNTSIPVRHRKKIIIQKPTRLNGNLYTENPSMSMRRNTIHTNEIDFSMIRAMKRFEIERDLLLQTCDTLERVKAYLGDRLLEMKDKQRSYCLHLSTAETTGIAPEPIYNRDLIADLLKLANTVITEANYDSKKSSDRSSSSLSSSSLNGTNNHYQQQLKAKDDRIKQLETEKRVLLKELVEMRHQHRTVIPAKNS
ncbi:unnamed protein product [Rotaria sordida]|uniref:Suppressor APC domain-containing protein n=1 Tax=Rotaria sordida TaxID=392033 RepID=A0A814BCI5_9BILA|nr:unnamed protein product [Rotaria sordida]